MTDIRKHIGRSIRQIRAAKKATQAEMAKQLAVSPATISGWEIGDFGISLEAATRVAVWANVSIDWLVTGKDAPPGGEPNELHTPEEERLLDGFKGLSKTSQTAILRVIEMMRK